MRSGNDIKDHIFVSFSGGKVDSRCSLINGNSVNDLKTSGGDGETSETS